MRKLLVFLALLLLGAPLAASADDPPIVPTFHLNVVTDATIVTADGFDEIPSTMYVCRWNTDWTDTCSWEAIVWTDGQIALSTDVRYFGGVVASYSMNTAATDAGWYITMNDAEEEDGFRTDEHEDPEPAQFTLTVTEEATIVTAAAFDEIPSTMYVCRWNTDWTDTCSWEAIVWTDGQIALSTDVRYFGGVVASYSMNEEAVNIGWYVTSNVNGESDGFRRADPSDPEPESFHLDVIEGETYVTAAGFEMAPAEMLFCRWDEEGNELPCATEPVTWSDYQIQLDADVFYFGGLVNTYSLTEYSVAQGWYVAENEQGEPDGFKRHRLIGPEPVFQLFVPFAANN